MLNGMDIHGRLKGLSLFSGIGGLDLALTEWVRTVAYCENDRYCQGVLLSNMQPGNLDVAPIWDDVRTLRADRLCWNPDIIFGGFPCQDISVAGLGAGLEGERSGLIFEVFRLVRQCRPRFVFLENVPAITCRGLDRILLELTQMGYDARWTIVSASEFGAPHLRKRWFLLAHSNGDRLRHRSQWSQKGEAETDFKPQHDGSIEPLADSERNRLQRTLHKVSGKGEASIRRRFADESRWTIEPNVGRVADGIPNRVDRLKTLGNAVVPIQAQEAFKRLMGIK
jgi:DNA (cytosine-5)-methyltransferase 1